MLQPGGSVLEGRRAEAACEAACGIEGNKRRDSQGIATTALIGSIPATEFNKVKAAAQATPPQQCQRYVVALVHRLEKEGSQIRLKQFG